MVKQRHVCGNPDLRERIGHAWHELWRQQGGGSRCHGTVKHVRSMKSRSRERRGGDVPGGERRRERESSLDLDSTRAEGPGGVAAPCIECGLVGERRRSWCDFGE